MKNIKGFTIVELLIVIVVIGVLTAISVVAYVSMNERARDSRRLQDVKAITKALEVYKVTTGRYPAANSASWEQSHVIAPFLDILATSGVVDNVPVDPVNTSSYYYQYYRYAPGAGGCDVSRGSFYVLQIRKPGTARHSSSPGFSCSDRDWGSDANMWYTIGGFEK